MTIVQVAKRNANNVLPIDVAKMEQFTLAQTAQLKEPTLQMCPQHGDFVFKSSYGMGQRHKSHETGRY